MIRAVVQGLNRFRADYAITGAIAVSYYGAPRTTIDFDLIVYASPSNLDRVSRALQGSGMQVDVGVLRQAARAGAFNIVRCNDKLSPHTVDIIFLRRKFRKIGGRALGLNTYYQPPEQPIRTKLRMIKATKPPERALKDLDDIRSILENIKVDLTRISRYAKQDTTSSTLRSVMKRAG